MCRRCSGENGKWAVYPTVCEVWPNTDDSSHSAGEWGRRRRAKTSTLTADMVNMHELGKNFVEEVIEVREAEAS